MPILILRHNSDENTITKAEKIFDIFEDFTKYYRPKFVILCSSIRSNLSTVCFFESEFTIKALLHKLVFFSFEGNNIC